MKTTCCPNCGHEFPLVSGKRNTRIVSKAALAAVFLKDLLSEGPLYSADIFREARVAGFNSTAVKKAASLVPALVVEKEGGTMNGRWMWKLRTVLA